jgi:hypothetical protein
MTVLCCTAVQTGTTSPIRRYRTVLCCTAVQTGTTSPIRRYRTVLCCTGRSDRYYLNNPQVMDCSVLYRPFRQVQPHQSAGTGLYCAVPAVQTGTASPIRRYRTVQCVLAIQTGTGSPIPRYRTVLGGPSTA